MTTPPSPGVYPHVPFEQYLAWDLPSQSILKAMRQSPAHYRAARAGIATVKVTDDMTLGSALHTVFLEPELAMEAVTIWRGKARRGAEWDGFKDENDGKYILTMVQHEKLVGMSRSLRAHQFVREWTGRMEATEVSVVGEAHGLLMKARVDALTDEPLVDLKKVRSCDERTITRTILDFGYHVQAYIYATLFKRDRFVLLCVEADEPYDVVPFELSPAFLREGEREAKRLIGKVLACERASNWPGRSDSAVPVLLEPPDWLIEDPGITIGAESASGDDDTHHS
ncbi:hypothetical protein LCGC14_0568760 [marine sediment metagenome]|uniref:Putative exodeoxyribonuclease 8 PDDEXK-like domain-containing protein n=1 Tax=marine sediment metagenome TaxID=412755 RepID=A0A0F9RJV3_9ZZZZ|nr:hypothetical protein [Phycisphaerae bacterium]